MNLRLFFLVVLFGTILGFTINIEPQDTVCFNKTISENVQNIFYECGWFVHSKQRDIYVTILTPSGVVYEKLSDETKNQDTGNYKINGIQPGTYSVFYYRSYYFCRSSYCLLLMIIFIHCFF